MNMIDELQNEQIEKLSAKRRIPTFAPGDTLRVNVKVVEGSRERIQVFEGVCIGRKNAGLNSAFTVRKMSYGEGVERVFPLYSPAIADIDVIRRGDVRRAKLYYLRGRTGKRARIAEKTDGYSAKIAAEEKRAAAETRGGNEKKSRKKGRKSKVEVPETGAAVTPEKIIEATEVAKVKTRETRAVTEALETEEKPKKTAKTRKKKTDAEDGEAGGK